MVVLNSETKHSCAHRIPAPNNAILSFRVVFSELPRDGEVWERGEDREEETGSNKRGRREGWVALGPSQAAEGGYKGQP